MSWELKDIRDKPATALVLPSARGMQSYRNLRQAVEKIYGSYSFAFAQRLVEELGAYQLEDGLAARLRRSGLKLAPDGTLDALSMGTYLKSEILEQADGNALGTAAMRARLETLPARPRAIYLATESVEVLKPFLRVWGADCDTWEQLECIDALECHRNPFLAFA